MKSENALSQKRKFTEERAARLRDPRARSIGIDKAALDEQVREKEALKAMERERDAFFDKQALLMDKHAQVLQGEVDTIRRQRELDVQQFRETYQKKTVTREWDLNDPKRVIGGIPARVNDTDARCGPSSGQLFEGEDLDQKERLRAQQQQLKSWAQQQMDEKQMKKWMEMEANRQYQDRAEEVAHRTFQIEQQIALQRGQAAKTTAEFNKALAEQKKREGAQSRILKNRKDQEEIDNMMNNDLLREDTSAHTRRADFKGMTNEQRRMIFDAQGTQRDLNREKRLQEAELAKQQEMQEAMDTRMAILLDRQRERERREGLKALGTERQQQAFEATQRKKATDNLYRNEIGDEFFGPLGRCE